MKKGNWKRLLAGVLSVVVFLSSATWPMNIQAQEDKEAVPDADIWMAETMILGYNNGGDGLYPMFQGFQEPVYKQLGGYLLEDVPLVSMSTAWSVFFNSEYRNQFANEQKYIYEIILMDYLKYNADGDDISYELKSAQLDFSIELYGELSDYLSLNRLEYVADMTVEETLAFCENIDTIENLSNAIGKVKKYVDTTKELLDAVSEYLAVQKTKDTRVALLKSARDACQASSAPNKDFIAAADELIDILDGTVIQYAVGETMDFAWKKGLDFVWDKLCDANSVLKAVDFGVAGLDACFDTSNRASNDLKLALLYTIDCYLKQGMMRATANFLNDKTSQKAIDFNVCFRAYVEFQMFGNDYVNQWLEGYLNAGAFSQVINVIFYSDNIKTAKELTELAASQISNRKSLLELIDKYADMYVDAYGSSKWKEEMLDDDNASMKVEAISLSAFCSGAIREDGSLWMWGLNSSGQLGDGTTEDKLKPVKVMENVKSISLGRYHSGAIKEDGSLWMWGSNSHGQLGDGTTENKCQPVKVMDDVKVISLGENFSGAIKKDGSLWMWGHNYIGQLGDGTKEGKLKPVKVMENVKAISLGNAHSGAIKEDGSLWMWGSNYRGELGDGTTGAKKTPIMIMENVKSISLGSFQSMGYSGAIKEDGSLWMWGENDCGKLGDGTTEHRYKPIKVMEDVKSISLGSFHSGAIKKDGSLWMWGSNNYGELGNGEGTTKDYLTSIKVINNNVKSISLGGSSSGAIKEDGSLWMWGANAYGQLGDGTKTGSAVPVCIMVGNDESSGNKSVDDFTDVSKTDWFYDYVAYVNANNLMTGLNETTFGPAQSLARAQFAVILYRMNGTPEITYTPKFPDVPDEQWFTKAILWANSINVVTGYTNTGLFGTADNINREQMAVMMYRYANHMGDDTSVKTDFSRFSDASSVSGFASEAMQWAVGNEIITGKDNGTRLDPQGNASRAECATIIMRFVEKYTK